VDPEDEPDSVESLLKGPLFALVIGIDAYEHFTKLKGAVADATAVADVLEGKFLAEPVDPGARFTVIRRTDHDEQPATREGIKSGFFELKKLLEEQEKLRDAPDQPNARVLIYFAGHGVATTSPEEVEKTPGYFLPKDANPADRKTYLSMSLVRELIKGLLCHHLLLVLDCCFAGAFDLSTKRVANPAPPPLYRENVERFLRHPAWNVITSAASDEKALDRLDGKLLLTTKRAELAAHAVGERDVHGAKSPFAVALVMGLQGDADFPLGAGGGDESAANDGVITGDEIHLYIENRFSKWEKDSPKDQPFQTPKLFSWPGRPGDKGQFIFRNPRHPVNLAPARELVEELNPYHGFQACGAKDSARFFGREALAAKLLGRVKSEPVVVVVGASGTGKSSLVCAGVLPVLDDDTEWLVLPAVRPVDALRVLDDSLDAFKLRVEQLFAQIPGKKVVAVIDQLEELIALPGGQEAIAGFFERVDAAVAASGERLHVVYTLRSDFAPRFAAPRFAATRLAKALFAVDGKGPFLVTPMTRDELRRVIERPAEELAFHFDSASLVTDIVDRVFDAPGALPLLSFTLREMYRSYARSLATRHDRTLKSEDHLAAKTALGLRASTIYDNQPDEAARQTMKRVLLRLVALDDRGEVCSRRVPKRELVSADDDETRRANRIVEQLVQARVVVACRAEKKAQPGSAPAPEEGAHTYVEAAHDELVAGWATRWNILNEHRHDLPLLHACMEAVERWENETEEKERCLWNTDPRRPQLEALQKRDRLRLNALETRYLAASNEAANAEIEKEKARKREVEEHRGEAQKASGMAGARELLERGEVGAASQVLAWVAEPEKVREWDQLARQILALPVVTRTLLHEARLCSAAWSPDGKRIVTACWDKSARVWNADGRGDPRILEGHTGRVHSAAWSPDGRRIVTVSEDTTLRVWSADGSGIPRVLEGHHDAVTSVAWSHDNQRIVTTSEDGSARVWNADGPGASVVLLGHDGPIHFAAWSPDGERVVTVSEDRTARVWNADGSAASASPVLAAHKRPVRSAAWSPDGKRIVTVSDDTTARVWSADGSRDSRVLEGHESFVWSAAWSPDGKHIVTASWDKTARVWNADGSGDARVLKGHTDSVDSAAWSPDGKRIVTASDDHTARVWSADGSGEPRVLKGHTDSVTSAAWSPHGGERILTVSEDKSARVWNADGPGARLDSIPALKMALRDATTDCLTPEQRQTHLRETAADARKAYITDEQSHGRTPSPEPPQRDP
jgi:WD40 repeat protein